MDLRKFLLTPPVGIATYIILVPFLMLYMALRREELEK